MSDSSDLDAALLQKLNGDSTLRDLMPGGAHWELQAPDNARQFVIVSLVNADDIHGFGGRAIEDVLYLVKAVEFSGEPKLPTQNIKAAAARIDALLDGGTLAPVGYHVMVMRRESRVRYPETDPNNPAIRWQHRGGHYQVMAAPTT